MKKKTTANKEKSTSGVKTTPTSDIRNKGKVGEGNAKEIRKKENKEDTMEDKEYEGREQISRGYVNKQRVESGEKSTSEKNASGARKKTERLSDTGSRDDDDDGTYETDTAIEPEATKSRTMYNSDENKEFQQREDAYRKGDKNQLTTQRNSSATSKSKIHGAKNIKTNPVKTNGE